VGIGAPGLNLKANYDCAKLKDGKVSLLIAAIYVVIGINQEIRN
jgi:hypothetical protein